jgi:hypothetical protein
MAHANARVAAKLIRFIRSSFIDTGRRSEMNAKTDNQLSVGVDVLGITSFGLAKMVGFDTAVPSLWSASQRRWRLGAG